MAIPVDTVAVQARLQPDRVAAIDLANEREWTYAALDRDIGACAAVLADHGLRVGDRLASHARNHVLLAILHAACARLGVIYVPLNWRLAGPEIAEVVTDCEPALLVQDDGEARGCRDLSLAGLDAMVASAAPLATAPHDGERPSLILYTSGTSGRAKGAVLSERALGETAINFAILGRVGNASRVLTDSPMFHVIGLVTNIRPYWMHGGMVIVSDGFDAGRTLARIADPALAATHYFCVPAMARMLRQHPDYAPEKLHGLTAIFTGGAPNHATDILAWADEGIAMVNGYGMSENGTLIGMPVELAEIRKRPTAAGMTTARIEMRIVDDADRPLSAGSAGEVQVRGANMASEYWRRPQETAKAFLPSGWFRTGDIGVIDAEGYVSIVDRKKDMFISGGENIYPAEIEAIVAEVGGIAECAVVGAPDPKWGEVGYLFVVARGDSFDRGALVAHLEARLARYKLPKRIVEIAVLPRNGAGKVIKADLKAMAMADTGAVTA